MILVQACRGNVQTQDVTVRVFVDLDEDGVYGTGDVPVPGVRVAVDEVYRGLSNDGGEVVCTSVSLDEHRFSVDGDELTQLEDSGFLPRERTQTTVVAGETEVLFPLHARGFVQVQMSSTDDAEREEDVR